MQKHDSGIACAIYARTNPNEDNLQAQIEARQSYIVSQQSLGWRLLPEPVVDLATCGHDLGRVALQDLLRKILQGGVGCVVVEQVHRLSTVVKDFSFLMNLFQEQKVTFACVRPPLNTSDSVGRLMLNVLLSLDQFEEESRTEYFERKDDEERTT